MAQLEVRVPALGDFKDVEIVEVTVKSGDTVRREQPLITLETDKAAMEVPSPAAGKVLELKVAQGGRVSTGDLVLLLEVDEAAAATPVKPVPAAADKTSSERPADNPATPAPPPAAVLRAGPTGDLPPIDEAGFARAHASPSVRKFARELGVDLGQVRGSGQKGRVLVDDVKAFVKSVMTGGAGQRTGEDAGIPKVPVVDYGKFGPVEVTPLSRVRKISGPRLQAAWLNIPHVTQQDEGDITELEAQRQKLKDAGVKVTPLAYFVRAAVLALKEFPDFNSSLSADGTSLVNKQYWHIGFAADTPQGLMVPVIRDADQKDIFGIARELATLSEKARAGKLTAAEMQGGTFTISSLGGIGGSWFTPIINAPEVAILGVGRAQMKPVWQSRKFVPRLMVPLSLSYDHRVIDGATGARFSTFLVSLLADVDRLLEV